MDGIAGPCWDAAEEALQRALQEVREVLLLGWERYDTHEAVAAINDLYGHELRLWLNLLLPSVKLVKKMRVGSKVRRVYDAPETPLERARRTAVEKTGRNRHWKLKTDFRFPATTTNLRLHFKWHDNTTYGYIPK